LLFDADMREMSDGLNHLQSILSTLPHAAIVVMRYLFAFLNQYVIFFRFISRLYLHVRAYDTVVVCCPSFVICP